MIENFVWIPCPYVRYVIYLISGILVASQAKDDIFYENLFVIATMLFVGMFLAYKLLHFADLNTILGMMGFIILFSLGAWRFEQNDQRNSRGHLNGWRQPVSYYTANVISDASPAKSYSKFRVFINSVKSGRKWVAVEANALLYVKTDTTQPVINYGDKLLLRGSVQKIRGPSNPRAFDYQNHTALQNIFHQHFTDRQDIIKYGNWKPDPILNYAYKARKSVKTIIRNTIDSERERSIIISLLTGERGVLNPRLKKVYGNVGAMHVLAVSGLHVGIVYLLFSVLLGFLKNHKRGKWFFLVICLPALWFYALLTGFSTSVLRAVVMFSIIVIGKTIRRNSNIYNNIALAAFLLLLLNPFYLFQVGFQLSFVAVVGIVYLQPKIAKWFYFKNFAGNKIWNLTAVSLAAQLATFPISIYYFHQFPTYFWLTNLLVIPAAAAIINLGIFIVLLVSAGIPHALLSAVLEKLVFFTNEGLILIEGLPLSSIHDLYLTGPDLLFIYTGMVAVIWFFRTFKIYLLGVGLMSLLLFSVRSFLHFHNTLDQRKIVFYHIPKVLAVDFIYGHNHQLFLMTNQKVDPSNLRAAIANYRLACGLGTADLADPAILCDDFDPGVRRDFKLFSRQGLIFLLLNREIQLSPNHKNKIKIDYLLINNGAVRDFDQIRRHFEFDKVIITNLNSFGYATTLRNYCHQNQINVHSIAHQGALIEDMKGINNLD